MNKKDKKKSIIFVLLLVAVIGIAGYGAYSYFWTEGTYEAYTSDSVTIASFNPEIEIDGDYYFVGEGGTVTLTCENTSTGGGTVDCTGSYKIYNHGGTPITVSAYDGEATVEPYNGGDYSSENISGTPGDVSFSWSDSTIAEDEYETLTISVPVTITSDFSSSSPVERPGSTGIYDGEALEVTVDFKIKASQVHN